MLEKRLNFLFTLILLCFVFCCVGLCLIEILRWEILIIVINHLSQSITIVE